MTWLVYAKLLETQVKGMNLPFQFHNAGETKTPYDCAQKSGARGEDCPPRTEGFKKGLVGNSSPPLFNLENRDPMEPLLYGAPFPAANTLPANNVFTIVFVNIHSNSQWLVRIRECTSRVSVWMCVCNVSVCVSWVATSCDIGKALKLIKKFLYWTQ